MLNFIGMTSIETNASNDVSTAAECCDDNVYHIKWIDWFNEKTPIITQNKNGPCPLLAIFNVLLLSRRVSC